MARRNDPRRSLAGLLKHRAIQRKRTAQKSSSKQQADTAESQTSEQLEGLARKAGGAAGRAGQSYACWGRKTTAADLLKVRRFVQRRKEQREDQRTSNGVAKDSGRDAAKSMQEQITKERHIRNPETDNGRYRRLNYGQRQRPAKSTAYRRRTSPKKLSSERREQKRVNRQVNRILQRKRQEAVLRKRGKAAKQTTSGVRAVAHGISAGLKAAFAALKTLAAVLGAAGGAMVCLLAAAAAVAALAASGFGIFLTGDDDTTGMTLQTVITSINQECIQRIQQIEQEHQPYDSVAIYGSKPSWKDVLAVYAATTTSDRDMDVATVDEEHRDILSDLFWQMTSVSSSMGQTTQYQQVEVDVVDEMTGQPTGEKKTEYHEVTTTVLKITVTSKTAADMIPSMSKSAAAQLTELLDSSNDSLWAELLGSFGGSTGALEGDEAKVASYLLGRGFSTAATAAILGNIKAECGWNYSTIGVLDGLYHPYERNIGIFQFTTTSPNPNSNNEYWGFMNWCEANGLYYGSLDAQLRWAFSGEPGTSLWSDRWHERRRYYSNAPGFTEDIYEHRDVTPEQFQAEENVSYAAYSWMAYYEGCTNGTGAHLDNRIAYAYEYYEQLVTTSSVQMIWPTDSSTITSYFGPRESPGGVGSTDHKGIDIAAPEGTPVYAAASGTVTLATYSQSAGNWIRIDHGNGICTTYMHCSALYVSEGDVVTQGQTIAAVGSTGHSTGPHLDFRVEVNHEKKNPLDFVSPP